MFDDINALAAQAGSIFLSPADLVHLTAADRAIFTAQIKAAQRAYEAFEAALRGIGEDLPPIKGETSQDLDAKAARSLVEGELNGVKHAAWDSGDMLSDLLDLVAPEAKVED